MHYRVRRLVALTKERMNQARMFKNVLLLTGIVISIKKLARLFCAAYTSSERND